MIDDGPRQSPMTMQQALEFESEKLPHGMYEEEVICDIANDDPDHLFHLYDSEFRRQLGRYLKSWHFRSKIGMTF